MAKSTKFTKIVSMHLAKSTKCTNKQMIKVPKLLTKGTKIFQYANDQLPLHDGVLEVCEVCGVIILGGGKGKMQVRTTKKIRLKPSG